MDANEYQERAMRFANPAVDDGGRIMNAALGLAGEAGEIADFVKKWAYQGHELDTTDEETGEANIVVELGDVAWYLALMCAALHINLADVLAVNLEKLGARYPDGFTVERSVNRAQAQGQGAA